MLYFISATVSLNFNKQPLALAFVYLFCKIILACCETNLCSRASLEHFIFTILEQQSRIQKNKDAKTQTKKHKIFGNEVRLILPMSSTAKQMQSLFYYFKLLRFTMYNFYLNITV
jgi:hypothetical protein